MGGLPPTLESPFLGLLAIKIEATRESVFEEKMCHAPKKLLGIPAWETKVPLSIPWELQPVSIFWRFSDLFVCINL